MGISEPSMKRVASETEELKRSQSVPMSSSNKKYQISTIKQDKGPLNTRYNRFKPIDFSHRKAMDTSITCMLQLCTSDLYVQVDEKGQL
jgi:hypothetical protein